MSDPRSKFDPDHFPVRLDHSLNAGKYKILRKLGQGRSSSSWLVHNEKGEAGDKYLAAKILTINATQRHDAGQTHELELMKEIGEHRDTDFPKHLYDHFVEQGPKSKHLCLVQTLCSTSVSSLRQSSPYKALRPYMTRNIVVTLLEALSQLHAMHIVHADVNLDNLLFNNSSYYLDNKMQQYLEANPTKIEGSAQLDGESYPIFKSQPIPNDYTWDLSAFKAELLSIYLMDFSHAQRAGQKPTAECSDAFAPRVLETILQSGFGPGVDIWAVGCITFELLVGRCPENGDWDFDNAGNFLGITGLGLEDAMKIYKIPDLSEDEIKNAADFIGTCLEQRTTADDLLKHRFLIDAFGS